MPTGIKEVVLPLAYTLLACQLADATLFKQFTSCLYHMSLLSLLVE